MSIYLLYVGRTVDNSVYIGEKGDSRIINWWQVCPLIFILTIYCPLIFILFHG